MSKGVVKHQGMVEKVTAKRVVVNIMTRSACAHCQYTKSCGMADSQSRKVEVANNYQESFSEGEYVTVWMKESLGFKALFLGYLLPFILMLTIIISLFAYTGNEGLAGIAGIGILFPYYFILYLQKDKIKNAFHFHLEKCQGKRNHLAMI